MLQPPRATAALTKISSDQRLICPCVPIPQPTASRAASNSPNATAARHRYPPLHHLLPPPRRCQTDNRQRRKQITRLGLHKRRVVGQIDQPCTQRRRNQRQQRPTSKRLSQGHLTHSPARTAILPAAGAGGQLTAPIVNATVRASNAVYTRASIQAPIQPNTPQKLS